LDLDDLPLAIYPYDNLGGKAIALESDGLLRWLWSQRAVLSRRQVFGKTLADMGRPWWEHLEHYADKLRTPLSIAFAFVATHNHFVLDRGGKVFKQSAPVIKLPPDATEDDHLALLGILNSSTACFWMQSVFHNKGRPGADAAAADERYEMRYEFAATGLQSFPLPATNPLDLTRDLQRRADELATLTPAAALARWVAAASADPPPSLLPTLKQHLADAAVHYARVRRQLIASRRTRLAVYACYASPTRRSPAAAARTAAPESTRQRLRDRAARKLALRRLHTV
jgi:hypothetical protein